MSTVFKKPKVMVGTAIGVLVIIFLAAFQPVTRNVIFRDALCLGCHESTEYVAGAAQLGNMQRPITLPHPATPEGGQARCIDCHLPPGFVQSVFAYTHIASRTDLFGKWHNYAEERRGGWITPTARRAYRVREDMLENDSATCRTCHIESEIKPKRKRGQRAHANAIKNKETCILCHDNLVHRPVPEPPETD